MLTKEYKGHEIRFNEKSEVWEYQEGGLSHTSLKSLLAQIDKAMSKREFDRIEVFVKRGSLSGVITDKLRRAVLTSILAGEREGWVSYEDGGRSKEQLAHLYPVNAHNEALADEIETNAMAMDSLRQENEGLFASLQRMKI